MNTTQEINPNQVYRDFLSSPRLQENQGEAAWLVEIRERAYERFQTLGFPTRKNEAWKYMNVDSVLNAPFTPADELKHAHIQDASEIRPLFLSDQQARMVFIDGIFSKELSETKNLPQGAILKSLKESLVDHEDLIRQHIAKHVLTEPDTLALANTFAFSDGIFFFLPKGYTLEQPIHFLFADTAGKTSSVTHLRFLIVMEEKTRAEIVFQRTAPKHSEILMNIVCEIDAGRQAKLAWNTIEQNASQLLATRAYLEEGSAFEMVSINENSAVDRNETYVYFKGKNASCSLSGLSVLSGNSGSHYLATVHHKAPECTSRQFYKNILAGEAKSEFTSLVHVYPDAQKSDSNQLNRNLLLSDKARAYARPQLKIDADDVKATHGAATGYLDENELFYLQSRGLNLELARLVLIFGFAEEVLQLIKLPILKEQLRASIRSKLETMIQKRENKL